MSLPHSVADLDVMGKTTPFIAFLLLAAGPAWGCPGDCDRNGQVGVPELVRGVRIALGADAMHACGALDADCDGAATIDELVATVGAALVGCPPFRFVAPERYATGEAPRAVAVGDLDNDGFPDIAVANHGSHDVSVLLNDGTGRFGAERRFPVGLVPLDIVILQLDSGDAADVITANGGSHDLSILYGRGDGTFAPETRLPAGTDVRAILVGDVDDNDTGDVVAAAPGGDGLPVLFGRDDGQFDRVVIGAGFQPWWAALGDLTGDVIPDLVTANAGSSDLTLLAGLGGGSFVGRSRIALPAPAYFVAIADVNSDGVRDLLTANGTDASVSLLIGRGSGTFAAPQRLAVGNGAYRLRVTDLNDDRYPDLLVPNELDGDISILLGRGDGTFAAETRVAVGRSPYALANTYLDRDRTPDLVAVSADNEVIVLRGACTP